MVQQKIKLPVDQAARDEMLQELLGKDDLEELNSLREKRQARAQRARIRERANLLIGLVDGTDGDSRFVAGYKAAQVELAKIEKDADTEAEKQIKAEDAKATADAAKSAKSK